MATTLPRRAPTVSLAGPVGSTVWRRRVAVKRVRPVTSLKEGRPSHEPNVLCVPRVRHVGMGPAPCRPAHQESSRRRGPPTAAIAETTICTPTPGQASVAHVLLVHLPAVGAPPLARRVPRAPRGVFARTGRAQPPNVVSINSRTRRPFPLLIPPISSEPHLPGYLPAFLLLIGTYNTLPSSRCGDLLDSRAEHVL